MSKFIAIHPVDPPASMDSVVPVAKKAKAGVNTNAVKPPKIGPHRFRRKMRIITKNITILGVQYPSLSHM
jgi:hypothetical protein